MKTKILVIVIILILTTLYLTGPRREKTLPKNEEIIQTSSEKTIREKGETSLEEKTTLNELSFPKEEPLVEGIECFNNLCTSTSCRVDYSAFPEGESFAKKVAKLCEENYPKIKQLLPGNEKLQPPYQIIFREKQSNPGETLGSVIYLNNEWFVNHPDDLGAIIHEMAHVVQAYSAAQPFWLVEGIADYVRYKLGYQNSWSYPHCGPGSESYNSGYWCSAAFLMFVDEMYDNDIIAKLNTALRENKYQDSLFQLYTGKNIEDLWRECQQSDCVYITP